MKLSKIALASATALLLTTALSNAQTTVGGNMRVGLKATSSDFGKGSNSLMTKETQINIANKGKLNVGGLDYAAGFSVELDGTDGTSVAGPHYENNYINIINASSGTTLHFGSDHVKPTDVQLSDIVAGAVRTDHVARGAASTSAGVAVYATSHATISGKGEQEAFGIGLIQDVAKLGQIRAIYSPDPSGTASAQDDVGSAINGVAGNAIKSYAFSGSLGVPGLTVLYGKLDQADNGAEKGLDIDTYGAKYTMGQFTAAYQKADGNVNTTGMKADSKEYGLAYAATKDLTIGVAQIKTKLSGSATSGFAFTSNEKITGINIGYSLGPVALQVLASKIDDAAGVAGQDGKAVHLSLGTTF
jgi:hypothetical protein